MFDQRITQVTSATVQILEDALLVLLFIDVLSNIDIFTALGEHGIDGSGQFMGGGRDRLWWAESGSHPPIVGAQGTLGVGQALRSETQGCCSPVGRALRFAAEPLPSGYLAPWAQPQP